MEPPAKRLRILRSVEVDETDPAYIVAKAKQNAKLKSKFESIFSKFEAMPEAMSDEIDMRTGKIVVDRGHMRKLNREYKRRLRRYGQQSEQLLDDLIANELEDLPDNDEAEADDIRDELAPSPPPEPRDCRVPVLRTASSTKKSLVHRVSTLPVQSKGIDMSAPCTPTSISNSSSAQLSQQSDAAASASWMQMIQFPQNPNGQQAQSAFMAQITQAVQQAITPIISKLLTPTIEPASVNAPAAPALITSDIRTTPAASFGAEPLSLKISSDQLLDLQSSPTFIRASERQPVDPSVPSNRTEHKRESDQSRIEPAEGKRCETLDERPDVSYILRNGQAQGGQKRKYTFTEADDLYITEQRTVLKRSWVCIKDSRPEWSEWPMSVWRDHWFHHLKQDSRTSQNRRRRDVVAPKEKRSISSHSCHFPTPSSIEREESQGSIKQPQNALPTETEEFIELHINSGLDMNDDQDLLMSPEPKHLTADDAQSDSAKSSESIDVVWPSVEGSLPINDDPSDRELSPPNVLASESKSNVRAATRVSPGIKPSMSPKKPKSKTSPIKFPIDSGDKLVLLHIDPHSTATRYICSSCKNSFPSEAALRRHKHSLSAAPPPANSTTISTEDDELLLPATPNIKCESATPPRNLLLITPTPHTPQSAPQARPMQSAARTSASKQARSALLRRIKQAWAVDGRKASPLKGGREGRRELKVAVRKRRLQGEVRGEGDSGDELAG